jgi:two-component system KDP operon response regulator KdpE
MKVLIIDDAPDVAEVVTLCFDMRWPNSTILTAESGGDGIRLAKSDQPDLVILDVMLPDMDGFQVCRSLRSFSDVPILMLSVRSDDKDIVKGLEWGADDYITKPFSHLQFLARVQALVRRTVDTTLERAERPYVSSELTMDFDTRDVIVRGNPVKLTNIEFKLLAYLVRNAGRPLSKQSLLSVVWSPEHEDTPYLPKVHVQHLRKKIERDPGNPQYILTERGMGYKFAPPR